MMISKAIPEPVIRLIEAFSRLPGVGPKTAARLTFYLLRSGDNLAGELSEALANLKSQTQFCSKCFNITVDDPCPICSDAQRDQHTVAVVEEPLDVVAIERTGSFRGVYHVLHGAISPINGIMPEHLKIRELVNRVNEGGIVEIIMAINPSLEGDITAKTIQKELEGKNVHMTGLARGLPVGSDIEYADSVTLARALQGRSEL
jgi:recombination protein RecR